MKKRDLTPALKRKQRNRRRKIVPMPTTPQVTTDSPAEILRDAYPISVYWDNDENCYISELPAFNNARLHSDSWQGAVDAAKVSLVLLITGYRAAGYTLPEVG